MRATGERLSPVAVARLAGVCYLLTVVLGGIGETLQSQVVVAGDAVATAARIAAEGGPVRAAFALFMLEMTCQVATTALFYELFRPVNRAVSLIAAFVSVVGITIKAMSRLFMIAPLTILGGAEYFTAFDPGQLNALAMFSLRLNTQGAGIALVFFGFTALLLGYLVLRSTFLPGFLGVLSVLGGIGWLSFLHPPFADGVFPFVAAVGILGALAMIGWLLMKGVDEARWREQAARA